jgi:DNA-binding IclR family transcriptional regulator
MVASDKQRSKYTVQSADKMLDILNVFLDGPARHTAATIAAATGIPRPTAFRLLSTLAAQDYLIANDGDYRLGHKCVLLGARAAGATDVREIARPVMKTLRDATGESVQLAVLDNWQVVYIEQELSERAIAYMSARVGSVLPAYCTGIGKALLAYVEGGALKAWAAQATLSAHTPTTLSTAEALLADLADVRRRGLAVDDEEREAGVGCVAAPITDGRGEVVAALSVAGPRERMGGDLADCEAARLVVEAADTISGGLGGGQLPRWRAQAPAGG